MSLENKCYIVNPVARGGKGKTIWDNVVRPLLGNISDVFYTEKGKTIELAESLAKEYDVLVSVGGDGNAGDIANALAGTGKTLGVIPMGSGNDFFFSLSGVRVKKNNYGEVIDILNRGNVKEIDLCKAIFKDYHKYYISVGEIGFSAEVGKNASPKMKKLNGTIAYVQGVLTTLFRYRPVDTHIKFNDKTIEEKCLLVEVNNGRSSGGGMLLVPEAKVDDGYLDICYGTDLSKMEILKVFPKVFSGEHIHDKKVFYESASSKIKEVLVITDPPVSVSLDGDIVGETPVRFEAKEKLKVIY